MYFTDTPELRKFEWEMKQMPNFDRQNDDFDKNSNYYKYHNSDLKSGKDKETGG